MDIIKKLKDNKIFKENSLIESTIEKSWMGSPVYVKGTLIVKKLNIKFRYETNIKCLKTWNGLGHWA